MTDKMPAKRRTGSSKNSNHSSSGNNTTGDEGHSSPQKDDPSYRMKRKRNNDAVRKAREKSKKNADERRQNVEHLHVKNKTLEQRIQETRKNIESLKELCLSFTKDTTDERDKQIQAILRETENDGAVKTEEEDIN